MGGLMATHGGRRTPAHPAPVSGPGALSRRTDGKQPIATPGLDNPDLQYGDIAQLRAGQHAAPLPKPRSPQAQRTAPGMPLRNEQLPPWLTQQPSSRPNEPGTTGLPTGPGAGPEALANQQPGQEDLRETTLRYLAAMFGNDEAYAMYHEILASKAAAPVGPGSPLTDAAAPLGTAPEAGDHLPPTPSPFPAAELAAGAPVGATPAPEPAAPAQPPAEGQQPPGTPPAPPAPVPAAPK